MNWLRKFMQGRNGSDQLNAFLVLCAVALWFVEIWLPSPFLSAAFWALMIWSIFRMMSRNVTARRNENYKFCAFMYRIRNWFRDLPARIRAQKEYRYFRCPNCSQRVRVPRHKGHIKVTCPRCGEKFDKRT
ncbi:MAG: hypothetical protein HDQ87_05700 [Clostridia bacterium]|nr:hypothetical protein [Clostridia bacterium]